MLLKIKFAVFSAIIIASGATETTTQTAVEPQSGTTELDNIEAVADSTHRDLYGSSDVVIRRERCPDDEYCETKEECENSEAAFVHGFNPETKTNNLMGGCVLRTTDTGRVSWVDGDPEFFRSNAPPKYARVCCGPRSIDTLQPTQSPTWLDDSWGGDKWDGGSKNSWSGGNNKWGWSGGSSSNQWGSNKWGWSGGSSNNNQWNNNKWGWSNKNDDWGGWEPSMNQWNHDGWHHDGWQDDGWNDDGFKKNSGWGWKGDDDKNRRTCDLSDCCLATCERTDFRLYRRFIRTSNGNDLCRLSRDDGGTGARERCNVRGFCYATDEGCQPRDCRC